MYRTVFASTGSLKHKETGVIESVHNMKHECASKIYFSARYTSLSALSGARHKYVVMPYIGCHVCKTIDKYLDFYSMNSKLAAL